MPITERIEFLIASALLNLAIGILAPWLDRFRERKSGVLALAGGILPQFPLLMLFVSSRFGMVDLPTFLHFPLESLFMVGLVGGGLFFMLAAGRYGTREENHRQAMWISLVGMVTGICHSILLCRSMAGL